MKCSYCGNEMESGVVQSIRTIFFTTKEHNNVFFAVLSFIPFIAAIVGFEYAYQKKSS